mmetsp:Transcript_58325/g.135770  ORF Transcript_58325/g.135770 Transcript_58325/m.135770 type:complete len:224 (+) Transcript_58325:671-1342(+)
MAKESHLLPDFGTHATQEERGQPRALDLPHQVIKRGQGCHEGGPAEVEPRVEWSVACRPLANERPLDAGDGHGLNQHRCDVQWRQQKQGNKFPHVVVPKKVVNLEVDKNRAPVAKVRQRCKYEGTEDAPDVEECEPEHGLVALECSSFKLVLFHQRCGHRCRFHLQWHRQLLRAVNDPLAFYVLARLQGSAEEPNGTPVFATCVDGHGLKLCAFGQHREAAHE